MPHPKPPFGPRQAPQAVTEDISPRPCRAYNTIPATKMLLQVSLTPRFSGVRAAPPGWPTASAVYVCLVRHEGSHLFPQHNPLEVMLLENVEDDDRHVIVHAQRKRRRIHHLALCLQCFQIAQARVTFRF